ncbi:MAG TPA: L-aspartate oxidase [Gemmatimonadaceae bacterium]|nr:L-aspartate oxidase [Gemmatimonadaceae bacterium]
MQTISARFLVIGSGVAGLHTALRAAAHGNVLLVTKESLFDSGTSYAQGGIAAALGAGDSPELHRQDTLAAGAALCDRRAVEVLVEEGPTRVRELQLAGARFDLGPRGKIALGREAAHSRRRIVHARGDRTGSEIVRSLIERIAAQPNVRVLEKTRVLDLIVSRGGPCRGARATIAGAGAELYADATVLAAGGCGQLYRYTTNPRVATGDGYAIAYRAGAVLRDMEFVQFHPTALDTPENPLALISEAVRGEGAVLRDAGGKRFMLKRHKLGDLAPRDVVAREIYREKQRTGQVWLDATSLGSDFATRFPGIFALCRARGIDPRSELIPVTPAAHYMMGGVATDLAGRSSVPRLYACGEVACTGVHGANRLASNSLLEGLVFAERVARDLERVTRLPKPRKRGGWTALRLADRGAAQVAADAIRQIMWDHVGIDRDAAGLAAAIDALADVGRRLPIGATEEANMVQAATLIARSALMRDESRGGHYRRDWPKSRRVWVGRHVPQVQVTGQRSKVKGQRPTVKAVRKSVKP